MEHPKTVGDRTTLAVITALHAAGYAVLVPFGENTRYDLVIDDRADLKRVQCKTGRLRGGAVIFATCSSYGHHRNPGQSRRGYQGQIDYFAVHCAATSGVYLVPISEVAHRTSCALRVEHPRNNQMQFVRFARDFEIATVRVSVTEELRVSSGAAGSSA